jgi:SAM-dependent methyltransferase
MTHLSPSTAYWDGVMAEWADARDALWRRHSDAVNAALLRRWLPAGAGRVLKTDLFDEAVSGGLARGIAGAGGYRVFGIDAALGVAAAAREAAGVSLRVGVADVRHLPFAAGAFDAVVSLSTLDHFDSTGDISTALSDLRRVLRPGGTLILTLDNPLNPAVGLRNRLPSRLLVRAGVTPYRTGRTVGPRRLLSLVTAAGFTVRETTAVLHVPRLPAVRLCRRAQRRGGADAPARLLRRLLAFERLASWPTRFLTGHFIAVRAAAS